MEMNIPPTGTIIAGKYRVERALGAGGMGVVLHATHILLNQGVALKLLHDDAAKNPEVVARFMREAQIAAQLPPDHIARVTDIGQTEAGAPYFVMELLTGRDVSNELTVRGPFAVADAVDIVLQACQGVAEAHAVGLVHRDLKPANLFLAARRGEPPIVKVLDFGISKSYDVTSGAALTQTTSNFGTPAYMSPEQIRSAKYVDHRSDQHSLGMILYELLIGRAPYQAESLTGLAVVISTEPPPHASDERRDVPQELDAAICKALAKRQPDRYPSLAGFAAAIAPFGGPKARAIADRIAATLASMVTSPTPSAPSMSPGSYGRASMDSIPTSASGRISMEPTPVPPQAIVDEASYSGSRPIPSYSPPYSSADPARQSSPLIAEAVTQPALPSTQSGLYAAPQPGPQQAPQPIQQPAPFTAEPITQPVMPRAEPAPVPFRPPLQNSTHSPTTSEPAIATKKPSRITPLIAAAFAGITVLVIGVAAIALRSSGGSTTTNGAPQADGTSVSQASDPGATTNSIVPAAPSVAPSAPSAAPEVSANPAPSASATSATSATGDTADTADTTEAPPSDAPTSTTSKAAPKPTTKAGPRPTVTKPAGRTPKRPRDVFGGDP